MDRSTWGPWAHEDAHFPERDPLAGGLGGGVGNGELLTDDVLLQICRVSPDHPDITSEWMADLRAASGLVGPRHARQHVRLEYALALLAYILGKLSHFNPMHLPFGYCGPTICSHNWIDRDVLERVGKQIVGLLWHRVEIHRNDGRLQWYSARFISHL